MRERGSFLFLCTVIFPFKASPKEERQKLGFRIQGIQCSRSSLETSFCSVSTLLLMTISGKIVCFNAGDTL